MATTIGLMALVVALVIVVEHYLPWERMLGRRLPRLVAYTLGLLAVAVPVTGWLLAHDMGLAALALWVAIVTAGLATVACYALDTILTLRATLAVERDDEEAD